MHTDATYLRLDQACEYQHASPTLKLELTGVPSAGAGRIQSPKYCLLPGDLRDAEGVQQLLQQAGLQPELPTLVLAECVLVYLQPLESASLLQQLGRLLPTAACIVYEQIRPDDAFGQQMLLNLEVHP